MAVDSRSRGEPPFLCPEVRYPRIVWPKVGTAPSPSKTPNSADITSSGTEPPPPLARKAPGSGRQLLRISCGWRKQAPLLSAPALPNSFEGPV
jgi:hypothetical protein